MQSGAMVFEEQLGQLLLVGFHGTTASPEIIDLVCNHHIGGVILFSRNVQDPRQIRELTQQLQLIAREAGHRYPLLIAIDQENGMVHRLGHDAAIFPGNMALGAIGSEQVAYDIAQARGRELHALGIQMNRAPVVDVNNNPANPVIGIRSFGEDPHQVARLASAMLRGYRHAGIMTCLKHFPGHGDTAIDSHLALPMIPYDLHRLEQVELVPFRMGIEAGADSIMTAHIAFPTLTGQREVPATLSPAVVQELLREGLGFDGVIISDCLEMNAIVETFGIERGTVMALQAGIDLVLISHQYARQQAGLGALRAAVQSGQISRARVSGAIERVLNLKKRFLSWETLWDVSELSVVGSESHKQLRDRAYERSTTLVCDDAGLLPLHLKADQQLLVIYPQPGQQTIVEDRQYPHAFLVELLRERHTHLKAIAFPSQATRDDYQILDQ